MVQLLHIFAMVFNVIVVVIDYIIIIISAFAFTG
jgi:hypothetical protein